MATKVLFYDNLSCKDYYLPPENSHCITYKYLTGILTKKYYCPKLQWMRMYPKKCIGATNKELAAMIRHRLRELCLPKLGIRGKHLPTNKWLMDVLRTIDPDNRVFNVGPKPPRIRRTKAKLVNKSVIDYDIVHGLQS